MASRPDQRTPVTIVTGFLGSGKTTFLNRALRSSSLANAAVVINEFGSVPLDHLLSEASDDQIVLLENGCLCCTVFGDLVSTLNRLYHAREAGEVPRFDRIVVETSGLADPRPVLQAFLSDPTLEGLFRVDAVLTIVDAINGPGTLQRHDESVHQLALADRILISKSDLVGTEAARRSAEDLRQQIRRINPFAELYDSNDPALDPVALVLKDGFSLRRNSAAVLTWLNADAAHVDEVSGTHEPGLHLGPKITSFCLVREEPTSLYGLELLLGAVEKNLGPSLLRLKGIVNVKEAPERPAVIHGAQHLLHNMVWLDAWPSTDRSTRIVFITTGVDRADLEEMISLLDRVARRTAAARDRAQSAH